MSRFIYRYLLKAGHFPGDTLGGHFLPKGHNLNKLGKVHLVVKHVTFRAGQIWPQGHNLNNLGRGLLGDATYHISRLQDLWFELSDKKIFSCFP